MQGSQQFRDVFGVDFFLQLVVIDDILSLGHIACRE